MKLILEQQYVCFLSYTANAMPADALSTLEATASAPPALGSK